MLDSVLERRTELAVSKRREGEFDLEAAQGRTCRQVRSDYHRHGHDRPCLSPGTEQSVWQGGVGVALSSAALNSETVTNPDHINVLSFSSGESSEDGCCAPQNG